MKLVTPLATPLASLFRRFSKSPLRNRSTDSQSVARIRRYTSACISFCTRMLMTAPTRLEMLRIAMFPSCMPTISDAASPIVPVL